MQHVRRATGHPQSGMPAAGLQNAFGITGTGRSPLRHASKLDASERRLHLGHAPIGPEALVQPAKPRRMLTLMHSRPALAVVLVGPHPRPQLSITGGYHAALTTRGHDLVLTEGPGPHMTDGTHRAPPVASPMGLGAVLDHIQAPLPSQLHDGVHITGPASQMNADDRPGALAQHSPDAVRRDVLGIRIHIGKYRHRPDRDNTGRGS